MFQLKALLENNNPVTCGFAECKSLITSAAVLAVVGYRAGILKASEYSFFPSLTQILSSDIDWYTQNQVQLKTVLTLKCKYGNL